MATATAPIRLDSARRTAALRAWLAASGFDAPGLRTLLGSASTSLVDAIVAPAARRRLTAADTPSAVLARLFLLGDEVSAGDAARRLGPLADELIALGLVTASGSTLQPAVRLVPHDHLLIASDLPGAGGADHVAAVHRPSALLAGLTVRRHVRRALDIGTGNGIQALLIAAHADRVIATDINERALEFAAFNCALNGVENVEFRSRQPARAGARRAVRPGRGEPAVRDLARPRRRVPRLGHGARRRVGDRRPRRARPARAGGPSRPC